MIEDIDTPQPFLKVYPPDHEVFAEPVARHARHLRALLSIDLAVVDPAWRGWIHVVNPYEPDDGYVGQNTQPFHNSHLRGNWVAFQMDAQDRYTLMGDFRYFHLENTEAELPDLYPGHRADIERHYAEEHASLVEARARHGRLGALHYPGQGVRDANRDFSQEAPCNLVDRLGGGADWGNWCNTGDDTFPLDDSDPDDVRPLAPDGTPFRFVASVCGSNYCRTGADSILLFHEPRSRTALLTFDWT